MFAPNEHCVLNVHNVNFISRTLVNSCHIVNLALTLNGQPQKSVNMSKMLLVEISHCQSCHNYPRYCCRSPATDTLKKQKTRLGLNAKLAQRFEYKQVSSLKQRIQLQLKVQGLILRSCCIFYTCLYPCLRLVQAPNMYHVQENLPQMFLLQMHHLLFSL